MPPTTPLSVNPGTVIPQNVTGFLRVHELPYGFQYFNKMKKTDVMTQVRDEHLEVPQVASESQSVLSFVWKAENTICDMKNSYLRLVAQINLDSKTNLPNAADGTEGKGEQVVLQYGAPLSLISGLEINISENNQTITNNDLEYGKHRIIDHLLGKIEGDDTEEYSETELKAAGLEHLKGDIFNEALGRPVLARKLKTTDSNVYTDFWVKSDGTPFHGSETITENTQKVFFVWHLPLRLLHSVFNTMVPTTRFSMKITFNPDNRAFWQRLTNKDGEKYGSTTASSATNNACKPELFRLNFIPGENKIFLKRYNFLASVANSIAESRNTSTGLPIPTTVHTHTMIQVAKSAGEIQADIVPIDSLIPPWFILWFESYSQRNNPTKKDHSPFIAFRNNVEKIHFNYAVPAYNNDYVEFGQKANYHGSAQTWEFKKKIEDFMNEGKRRRSDFSKLTEIAAVLDLDEGVTDSGLTSGADSDRKKGNNRMCYWVIKLSPIMRNEIYSDPIGGNWQGSATIRIIHGDNGATQAGVYHIRRVYPSTARYVGQTSFQDDRTVNDFKLDINVPK